MQQLAKTWRNAPHPCRPKTNVGHADDSAETRLLQYLHQTLDA